MKTKFQSLLFLGLVILAAWLPSTSFASAQFAANALNTLIQTEGGFYKPAYAAGATGTLSTSSGGLVAHAPGSFQIANRAVPVAVKRSIGSAAAALAIKNAFPLLAVATTGLAIVDLAIEMGYVVNPFGVVTKPLSNGSTVTSAWNNFTAADYAGCQASVGPGRSCHVSHYYLSGADYCGGRVVGPGICHELQEQWSTGHRSYTYRGVWEPTLTPPTAAASVQELTDAIAARSVWPSTSKLADTLADAVKAGQPLPSGVDTITGPATVPGTKTTTANPDGSTTTKVEVHNVNYEGNKITVTTTTTSTTVMPDGTTKTETETKENEPQPQDQDEDFSATDTPLPDQPKLYEQKYKDGLTGVWRDRKAELNQSPLLQLSKNMMPTIGSSSGYPSWPIGIKIGPWDFGTYDVSPAGYVWDFLKVCVIVSSLFLARKLIFGG